MYPDACLGDGGGRVSIFWRSRIESFRVWPASRYKWRGHGARPVVQVGGPRDIQMDSQLTARRKTRMRTSTALIQTPTTSSGQIHRPWVIPPQEPSKIFSHYGGHRRTSPSPSSQLPDAARKGTITSNGARGQRTQPAARSSGSCILTGHSYIPQSRSMRALFRPVLAAARPDEARRSARSLVVVAAARVTLTQTHIHVHIRVSICAHGHGHACACGTRYPDPRRLASFAAAAVVVCMDRRR